MDGSPRTLPTGADEAGGTAVKFYELRDNLCEKLGLVNHAGTFDLWDQSGRRASVYREFDVAGRLGGSSLLYVRQNLLEKYLEVTKQALVWIPWGERTLHHKLYQHGGRPEGPGVDEAYDNSLYTFGELVEYDSLSGLTPTIGAPWGTSASLNVSLTAPRNERRRCD